MRTNFVLKTPKAMALSYFNDTFINDMWTMQERKQQCYQLVTSYIATKELDDRSKDYWINVVGEILKIDL